MKSTDSPNTYKHDLYYLIRYFHKSFRKSLLHYKQFSGLQQIIRHKMLTTYFQPIINLQDGNCLGYEILNRPPASPLFPNTESFYEFIGDTDQVFAFERFCREISIERFKSSLIKEQYPNNTVIFLNIHPQVLADSTYRNGETITLLNSYGLSPEQVVFELTEKQAVQDYVEFERILSNYRSQGFRIAIDDAGSGYSSLKAIVSLKPDFIKLDRALINHVDTRSDQQNIVRILKQYAAESDTHIIAEGIEREEEIHFLRSASIEYGQGYAIGRPDVELKCPLLATSKIV
ncbi:EAL domain-containing protein [Paenibacillus sp. ACRRY]|uniref:EAL domain-containing protein n=1 Tax=Paenibacillus sp. ACRRY TaxID=2918208 RepID=UPI001EF5FA19|nr:EAL domain-containing protein [Paenibacillus sp. ACRRY]MCG7383616.1 EAL domain-containing protein [Paenibacillus sp. ACRRY]